MKQLLLLTLWLTAFGISAQHTMPSQVRKSLPTGSRTYMERLNIIVNDQSGSMANVPVVVTINEDQTIDFTLENLILPDENPMYVGTISIQHLPITEEEGVYHFEFNDNLLIQEGSDPNAPFWIGPQLGPIPLNMKGKINEERLAVHIDINMQETIGQIITVTLGQEDLVTGIRTPYTLRAQDSIYDLMGRRWARPQRGINIIGNKKVLVR